MAFCPECRSEYRAGVKVCEACGGVALVEELKVAESLSSDADTEAVAINRESSNPIEVDGQQIDPAKLFVLEQAKEIEGRLIDSGFATLLRPLEHVLFPDGRARFEVHVLRSDFDRAQDCLDKLWRESLEREGGQAGLPTDVEVCPACGANVPANVAECPDCGLFVGALEEDEQDEQEGEAAD